MATLTTQHGEQHAVAVSNVQRHQVPTPLPRTNLRMANYTHTAFASIETVTRARKLIKRGFISLNGETVETSRYVKSGDILTVDLDALAKDDENQNVSWTTDISVLYEDERLAVVEKPAGILTSGARKRTLEHALSSNVKVSTHDDALLSAHPVHRLDLAVGGLVCVAKTRSFCRVLCAEFEQRRVRKRYRALVVGYVQEDHGVCTTPIDDKEAQTTWAVVSRSNSVHTEWITTLDLWPHTGRKHQLRRHCAIELGHPIVGDTLYTPDPKILCRHKGIFLKAVELTFASVKHDVTGECLHVELPEPNKFVVYRNAEKARYWRHFDGTTSKAQSKVAHADRTISGDADQALIALLPPRLKRERRVRFDASRYDLRRVVARIIAPQIDSGALSQLHCCTEASERYLTDQHAKAAHAGRTCYNKRWRSTIAHGDDEFREVLGLFVEEIILPELYAAGGTPNCEQCVVYQRTPTLRVHMPGPKALGVAHIDYTYFRQPTEVNVWLPLTPVAGSNSLWSESAPGARDFAPFEVDGFGEAVLFWGNQCEHYSLPNETDVTRVSLDFRVVRADLFQEAYISPLDKKKLCRFQRGEKRSYTDTIVEAAWRLGRIAASSDHVGV